MTSEVPSVSRVTCSWTAQQPAAQLARAPAEAGNVPCPIEVPLLRLGWTLPCCYRHYSISNLHAVKYARHRKSVRECGSVISKDRLHCLAFKIALPK